MILLVLEFSTIYLILSIGKSVSIGIYAHCAFHNPNIVIIKLGVFSLQTAYIPLSLFSLFTLLHTTLESSSICLYV